MASDWLTPEQTASRAILRKRVAQAVTEPHTGPDGPVPWHRITDATGVLEACGWQHRQSIAHAIAHNGFPRPAHTLPGGFRLWDRLDVEEWARINERTGL